MVPCQHSPSLNLITKSRFESGELAFRTRIICVEKYDFFQATLTNMLWRVKTANVFASISQKIIICAVAVDDAINSNSIY